MDDKKAERLHELIKEGLVERRDGMNVNPPSPRGALPQKAPQRPPQPSKKD